MTEEEGTRALSSAQARALFSDSALMSRGGGWWGGGGTYNFSPGQMPYNSKSCLFAKPQIKVCGVKGSFWEFVLLGRRNSLMVLGDGDQCSFTDSFNFFYLGDQSVKYCHRGRRGLTALGARPSLSVEPCLVSLLGAC